MEEQDTIDLGQVWQVAKANQKRLIGIIVASTLIALVLAFILPKQYESTVLVRAKNQTQTGISLQATAALALLGGSTSAPLQSYREMLKSRSVLEPVIEKLDLPEEDKEKLTNESFAKTYLKFENPKGTDLLQITATGRSPEEAQFIAASVLSSFQQVLTNLNQSEQSLQIKFLSERITVAKGEMEQAEKNLEQFRQQTKIYIPDEQAKAAILALSEADQKLAQLQVTDETNRAKLQGVDSQLREQNAAMAKFNIAENEVVGKIRTNIIDKQMNLVTLQQRYTDKHPEVILAKKEIDELTATLQNEIAKSIQSGANILNPIQGSLLNEKVATETAVIATQATIAAMKQVQAKTEKDISNLSSQGLTYIGLERQARVSREVYAVLVQNYEQARIQEAMESMDIQVVDGANLPKEPSAPGKLLLTVIGGVLGVMLAFAYLMIVYMREAKSEPAIYHH
ncbi:GumC family protein [Sporomusa sp. GT1]|uniref:GumC family protein n=1 Tax=Sporomusa sp. GT1 TaxID=1534747 RepID=UPI0016672174|nr:GumC family protein [Sporomusa sp. GT1]